MPSLRWSYDQRIHNYRDGTTGRFLPRQTIVDLRDELLDSRVSATKALASALADGRIDLPGWQTGMRAVVKDTMLAEYLFGRGGINAMTQADYGRVGSLVKEQYTFLQGFAQDVADGNVSEKQLEARAAMYAHAGVQAHSIGQEASYGGRLNLPAHPGQGTDCKVNCRCHWRIQEGPEAWVCTWVREARESCATCISRAAQYNPFIASKVQLRVVALWTPTRSSA